MTIPEAAQLVLQAAAMGRVGRRIFVLEMGEPVRILDLARKMVLLSGLRPDIDIRIVFSGTRPGEKLYEEVSARREYVHHAALPDPGLYGTVSAAGHPAEDARGSRAGDCGARRGERSFLSAENGSQLHAKHGGAGGESQSSRGQRLAYGKVVGRETSGDDRDGPIDL